MKIPIHSKCCIANGVYRLTNMHKYRWSSHKDYLNGNKGFVDTDKVLRLFSENPTKARRLYEDFINETIGLGTDKSLYKVVNQQILGMLTLPLVEVGKPPLTIF